MERKHYYDDYYESLGEGKVDTCYPKKYFEDEDFNDLGDFEQNETSAIFGVKMSDYIHTVWARHDIVHVPKIIDPKTNEQKDFGETYEDLKLTKHFDDLVSIYDQPSFFHLDGKTLGPPDPD